MHWDTLLPAFGVRVQKRVRTFLIVLDGGRRIKLGRYPDISLAKARELARARMQSPQPTAAFADILNAYAVQHLQKNCRPATAREIERILRRDFPLKKQIGLITKADVSTLIDRIDGKSAANHATVAIKMLFNWAEAKGYIEKNVIAKLPKPYRDTKRDRVLSDEELAKIWKGSVGLGDYGCLVRLCLLTAQRRGSIAALQPGWLTSDAIEFPAAAMKSKRDFSLPLTPMIEEIAKQAPFVCRTWSKPKRYLDTAGEIETEYTLHDLRRTAASRMAALGVQPHVIERGILAHAAPLSLGGEIAAIYNRHQYLDEARDALLRYEQYLVGKKVIWPI